MNTDDYTYKTVEDYEKILGHKVADPFRVGWQMARTTNAQLGIMVDKSFGKKKESTNV